jgi:hypothetical protein
MLRRSSFAESALRIALENPVGDRRCVDQDLDRRLAAFAVRRADESLRNDRAQVRRQVHQKLIAAIFREKIGDAVERLVRVVGVQRTQAKMPGFGEGNCMLHRFGIANLADEDDVGCLTQRVLQRVMPRVRVHAHFAVRDQGVLGRVYVLDRIFDRDDVTRRRRVAMVDHRGERRRFS